MPPINMSPQEFIRQIAEAVAQKITSAPPKAFDVRRTAPDGQQKTEPITLPQAIAELSDNLRIANELKKIEIDCMQGLILVLEQNRKLGKAMLKKNKRGSDDEEDEE